MFILKLFFHRARLLFQLVDSVEIMSPEVVNTSQRGQNKDVTISDVDRYKLHDDSRSQTLIYVK